MYSGLTIILTGSPGASRTNAKLSTVMPTSTGTEINTRRAIQAYTSGTRAVGQGASFHSAAFQKPKVSSPCGLMFWSLLLYAHTAAGTYSQMYGTSSLVMWAT